MYRCTPANANARLLRWPTCCLRRCPTVQSSLVHFLACVWYDEIKSGEKLSRAAGLLRLFLAKKFVFLFFGNFTAISVTKKNAKNKLILNDNP